MTSQLPLIPAPDTDCEQNLCIYFKDGEEVRLCCCEECTCVRKEQLEALRAAGMTSWPESGPVFGKAAA